MGMVKREYLYKVETDDGQTYCIMFHLGKYAVVRLLRGENGTMCYTIRQYKTVSGAERYLGTKFNGKFTYGPIEEIWKGEYWR